MKENLPDITQTVLVEAPIQKVWDYVSTAEGISAWFMPNDFQAQEGYEFTIQSPFGPSPCKVLEIDEPHKLSFQWDTDGWFVTFLLKENGAQTEFTLIHGGWKDGDSIVSKAKLPNSAVHSKMEQGWIGIVQNKFKQVVEA
ncbi:SRPBCC domain-containing protein [Psychrobacillus sp. NPDC096623]|uniref:SRPBCC family protein n=1 Tax=Psychrobacillus sp. NPDC096623 TaxID=3364492 RepID=UPI00381C90A0